MAINLRQYNLKPNSNYNVSLTMKKGDRIIDGLRSVYVSTPKYLTTSIENASTTSTIIFDRSYTRHTIKEPSVEITLPTAGKLPSTEIIKWEIKEVECNFSISSPQYIVQGAAGYAVKRLAVDIPRTLTFTMTTGRTYNSSATVASSNALLRSLNRPVFVKMETSKKGVTRFEVVLSAREIDPGVTWIPNGFVKNGGYWSSETLSKLYINNGGAGKGGIITKKGKNIAADTWLNISVNHPEIYSTPGSTKEIAGEYVDTQGLTQTLKTSLNNQDIISQLYWDDIDETDAIRDVVYFFFRDDTGDNSTTLNSIKEWIYLDESFVSASPIPTSTNYTSNNYVRASGNKLTTAVPVLEEKYLQLSEPQVSLTKNIYQTIDQYRTLETPTQVKVAFTIARYKKNKITGAWDGSWLKTYTSGNIGYPVLSTPEILSGSS
jgi:hypothetical protein